MAQDPGEVAGLPAAFHVGEGGGGKGQRCAFATGMTCKDFAFAPDPDRLGRASDAAASAFVNVLSRDGAAQVVVAALVASDKFEHDEP